MKRAFLIALISLNAHADPDCIKWAHVVEALSKMTPVERIEARDKWVKQANHGAAEQYIISAYNWVLSGASVEGAWYECRDDMV